jgi:hypothetical protein
LLSGVVGNLCVSRNQKAAVPKMILGTPVKGKKSGPRKRNVAEYGKK